MMFADDALWLNLIRGSYKATLPQETFSYRLHPEGTSHSPDWRSTFDSLGAYLDFLIDYGGSDREVKDVLERGVAEYLVFWFRWAYFFASRGMGERPEILRAIATFSAKADVINGCSWIPEFNERGRTGLFDTAPQLLW